MRLKKYILPLLMATLIVPELSALTLQESVSEVLDTNPVVVERLKNYRATRSNVDAAQSGYFPTIDLQTSIGREEDGVFAKSNNIDRTGFNVLENSIILRQNLFEGFGTVEKVNYEKMRTLAASYSYLEKANDISLQMINAYLDILRQFELTVNARENLNENRAIYEKVQTLYDGGLTTLSEVEKIKTTVSLAESNLLEEKNQLREARYKFRRILGRNVEVDEMNIPEFNLPMPSSLEEASSYALEYNPSLQVSRYNIKGAQSLYKQTKKNYYPTLDLELSENYNDYSLDKNSRLEDEEYFRGMLVLRYNLYRGGSDRAAVQSNISKINQEVARQQDLRRQVIEGLSLSWSAYDLSKKQIPVLDDYYTHATRTLKLYIDEYSLGKRSLLDLLAAQNDVARSNAQSINANYKLVYAQYRILDAMGLTIAAMMGDVDEYYQRVGLGTNGAEEVIDKLPISNDRDEDRIVDDLDICDNSEANASVQPYGCTTLDYSLDGIDDMLDGYDYNTTELGE